MSGQVEFTRDPQARRLISKIARRARQLDYKHNRRRAATIQHHMMNVSACHASGNPLRLADLLAADDFNFAHDIFGIDRHINHENGRLDNCFVPRFSNHGEA